MKHLICYSAGLPRHVHSLIPLATTQCSCTDRSQFHPQKDLSHTPGILRGTPKHHVLRSGSLSCDKERTLLFSVPKMMSAEECVARGIAGEHSDAGCQINRFAPRSESGNPLGLLLHRHQRQELVDASGRFAGWRTFFVYPETRDRTKRASRTSVRFKRPGLICTFITAGEYCIPLL